MSSFFKEFDSISKQEWSTKIHADLRGKDPSLLRTNDQIEELDFSCFYHSEDQIDSGGPGSFPFTRGTLKKKNSWANGVIIEVNDEATANKKALNFLMSGADLIWFKSMRSNINWSRVFVEIQLDFIHTEFTPISIEDLKAIKEATESSDNVQFNVDGINDSNQKVMSEVAELIGVVQHRYLLVNGAGIQQSGSTTWQEIAFCLNAGHEYLIGIMNEGWSIDNASECISFHIGIGSNYFYEIAKIRAMKQLWSKIIEAYSPESESSYKCSITAIIGHSNKSLTDPYTNLLRQTTETMSALSSGVDKIIVQPYDQYSTNGTSELAQRTALNIPLILKEESYFDMVIDPLGGSYTLEQLTDMIARKAWIEFQLIEKEGGLFNATARQSFTSKVKAKKAQRIEHFQSDQHILIGINKYLNPEKLTPNWAPLPKYMDIEALTYELITKKTAV